MTEMQIELANLKADVLRLQEEKERWKRQSIADSRLLEQVSEELAEIKDAIQVLKAVWDGASR